MMFPAFSNGMDILEKLERHGHSAFFVGGAVRDFLIGRPVGDIDITTSAKPEQVMEIFPKVIPVGIEHGTVIVRHVGESFEVTTFRVEEGYSDFRHPDEVEFVDDLEQDLARRDFTMNAIAMDRRGKVIDPYDGENSIKNKVIRTVGVPAERFAEDPLRMLRALRFASQLDYQLDSATFFALAGGVEMIKEISIERIAMELEKLFAGPFVSNGIELLNKSNLINCLPVFEGNQRLQAFLWNIKVPFGQLAELICMLVYWEKRITISEWIKAWKLSNRTKKDAEHLLEAISCSSQKQIDAWLVYRLPSHLLDSFIRLHTSYISPISREEINKLINSLPIRHKKDLSITGADLIEWFPKREKGPWINQALTTLEKMVVIGVLPNQKKALKEWLIREYHPQSTD